MIGYRVELTPDDNGTLLVTCPQLPMVVTYGDTEDDALRHAVDAVETAIASMIDDGEEIPRPLPASVAGQDGLTARVPLLTSLKLQLYWALRDARITRAELARRLGWHRESVDRLFRVDHNSRVDQLEAAFNALGNSVDVEVVRDVPDIRPVAIDARPAT
jgi:antitoxin HicB